MGKYDYRIYVLSHGRPDVETLDTLRKQGYTNTENVFVVVDDADTDLGRYEERFADRLLVFNKDEVAAGCDMLTNEPKRNTAMLARNFIFDHARANKVRNVVMMDDDIIGFTIRKPEYETGKLRCRKARMGGLIEELVRYNVDHGVWCVGGANAMIMMGMKSFVFNMSAFPDAKWRGYLQQDEILAFDSWRIGKLVMCVNAINITCPKLGTNKGGLNETYNGTNDYVRGLLKKMTNPSCVKIVENDDGTIGDSVESKYCFPKVISSEWKKDRR